MLTFEIRSSNIRNAQKAFAPVRFAALAGLTALAIGACSTSPGRPASGTAGTSGAAGSAAGTSGAAGSTAGTTGAAGDTAGTSGAAGSQGMAGATGGAGVSGAAGMDAGVTGSGGMDAGNGDTAAGGSAPCGPGMALSMQGADLVQATIAKLPMGKASRTIELWAYFDGSNQSWINEHGLFEYGAKAGDATYPSQACHEFGVNSTNWATGQAIGMLH